LSPINTKRGEDWFVGLIVQQKRERCGLCVGSDENPTIFVSVTVLVLLKIDHPSRVLLERLAKPLQLPVNPLFAQGRLERGRVAEDVDVFRESVDQAQSLGQAGATLEDNLGACRLLDEV
jgi:hypothetical protein